MKDKVSFFYLSDIVSDDELIDQYRHLKKMFPELLTILDDCGDTILHQAIQTKNISFVSYVLRDGMNADGVSKQLSTPLQCSVIYFQLFPAGLYLLLAAGASINAQGVDGSALHVAASKGIVSAIDALVLFGADIDLKHYEHDHTPLHSAILHEQEEACELLVKRGANANLPERLLGSPRELAKTKSSESLKFARINKLFQGK